jgi:hypothetical protein
MPSKSTAQQRLMGMAYALKKGDMDPSDASDEVKDLAKNMTLKQLKDFASTKHDGLPDHVNEWLPGVSAGQKWYTQPAQSAGEYGEYVKDHTDKLIKSFIEFVESGKKPKTKSTEDQGEADAAPLAEDASAPDSFSAPQASVDNTPGMGNVEPATIGAKGSGDTFGGSDDDDDEEEEEKKKKVGIMSYEKYKKWLKKWQMQNK